MQWIIQFLIFTHGLSCINKLSCFCKADKYISQCFLVMRCIAIWKMWDLKREGSGKIWWWSSRVKSQWALTARPGTGAPGDTQPINQVNRASRNSELPAWESQTGPWERPTTFWRQMLTTVCQFFLTLCSSCLLCKSHQTPKVMKLVRFVAQRYSSKSFMATADTWRFQYVWECCRTPESAQL